MLKIMLRKAYDDLNKRIIDFSRYIDFNEIKIYYANLDYCPDNFTKGQVSLKKYEIDISAEYYEECFKLASLAKLARQPKRYVKELRKDIIRKYDDCIKTIKHELIHLYLYEKYDYLEDTEPYGNYIYSDLSPLFMIYCELCEAGISSESKMADLYGFAMLFAKFYKENYDYKNGLYELRSFTRTEFRNQTILAYFNAYAAFEKLNVKYKNREEIFFENKQDIEVFEGIKKVVRDRLCSWDIDISKRFKICS